MFYYNRCLKVSVLLLGPHKKFGVRDAFPSVEDHIARTSVVVERIRDMPGIFQNWSMYRIMATKDLRCRAVMHVKSRDSSNVLPLVGCGMIPGYLELESAQLTVPEDAGFLQVKVLRKEGHDGQIRMRYKTTPVTAQPNSDFSPITGELIFEEGEDMKMLKVDILDDTLRESPETFRIELFDPSVGMGVLNFRNRGSVLTTDVTIEDNDSESRFCS
ncbi:g-protein coupled receptor 98 [Trichonephila clavipes]|nr:g-protein coupled receptor 98 [Trichonephila clavipes]